MVELLDKKTMSLRGVWVILKDGDLCNGKKGPRIVFSRLVELVEPMVEFYLRILKLACTFTSVHRIIMYTALVYVSF